MDQVSNIIAKFLDLWSFFFNLIWKFIIHICSNCLTVPVKDLKLKECNKDEGMRAETIAEKKFVKDLKLKECNKDEAMRAKTIAEKKFADRDFAGAKKLALKAQTLYPGLDGISRMLITLDMYICYERKVNGESDWYGILNVNPSDDDKTIRRQYKKLALKIHPDKSKSVGADDAFKILSEAWTLLSDKSKRAAYNQRRNPKVSSRKERPSADRSPKDSNSTTTSQTSPTPVTNPATTPAPAPAPVDQGIHLFCTSCYRCKMSFQLPEFWVNQTILCRNCNTPFIAAEMLVPMYTIPSIQLTGSLLAASLCGPNNNTHAQFGGHPATTPDPALAPFWTSCYGCQMSFQYPKIHVNKTILCFICRMAFIAAEMLVPMNYTIPSTSGLWSASLRSSNNNTHAQFGGQSSNVNRWSNFYTFRPGSNSFAPGFY